MEAVPERLFKYLPEKYAEGMLLHGELLFRNLSYFRQNKQSAQGDFIEGSHMDFPDHDVTLTSMAGTWKGRAAFFNTIGIDRVFVYCLSTVFSPALFKAFGADACIEIHDTNAFLSRVSSRVARDRRFRNCSMFRRRVEYFAANQAASRDITQPYELPFFKRHEFAEQHEYRLVVPLPGAWEITRSIELPSAFEAKSREGTPGQHLFRIGEISDIAVIRRPTSD